MNVADIRAAKAALLANDDPEPYWLMLTRPEARSVFGAESIEGLPDRQIVHICGYRVYLVGEKWPPVPLQLTK